MIETKEHTGFKRLTARRKKDEYLSLVRERESYKGIVICPFCERENMARRSTFLKPGKRCICTALINLHKATLTDSYNTNRAKSPYHAAFKILPQEDRIKICTAFSLSGDGNEIARLYNMDKQVAQEEIMLWLKDKQINAKVLENCRNTTEGIKYMKHSFNFDGINNHESNHTLNTDRIFTVRTVCESA